MLEFLYTGQVNISPSLAVPLLIASEKFLLPRLKFLSEEAILDSITHENAIPILLQSYLHNAYSLQGICLDFIVDNIDILKHQQQFEILKQEPELLMDIIKHIPTSSLTEVVLGDSGGGGSPTFNNK